MKVKHLKAFIAYKTLDHIEVYDLIHKRAKKVKGH